MNIKVSGIIHEKTSKKGGTYIALDVALTPSYTKTFFLDQVDIELIKQYLQLEEMKNNAE